MSFEQYMIPEEPGSDGEKKEICRDFKKGDCRRREKCIYHHPKLNVCRDFQFRECTRRGCKYVHVTKSEEEDFDGSGVLPRHTGIDLDDQFRGRDLGSNKRRFAAISSGDSNDLCRDFEKGDCRRRDRCKFYHPKLVICRDFQKEKCDRPECRFLHMTKDEETTYEDNGIIPDHIDKRKLEKNRIMSPSSNRDGGGGSGGDRYGKRRSEPIGYPSVGGGYGGTADQASVAVILVENEALKVKLLEMQQQISDLRKMNDTLYEQNQNYRNSGYKPL